MKPAQTLYRYQHAYQPLNGSPYGASRCSGIQRHWRNLLTVLVLALLIIFCYWTFQSLTGSPFLFERASEEPPFALAESTDVKQQMTTIIEPMEEDYARERISHPNSTNLPTTSTFSAPTGKGLPQCPEEPPNLVGPIPVWMDGPEMARLEQLYPRLGAGGHGWPFECRARHRVAIIVPYRDREKHLRIFLHNLHAFLGKQQLDYGIFIVEQAMGQTFNRGKLMNVGFLEASRLYDWQCFVFHDVDLLPEDDRNLYSCPQQPRHMSVAVDKFKYKLPYSTLFGGAEALTRKQFEKINGFSNDYWGWGGEDDDISARLTFAGFTISRYPSTIARYKMVSHSKDARNPVNGCRYALLDKTKKRWRRDGLSNLDYRLLSINLGPLYTNITVDLLEEKSRKALSDEHIKRGC